MPPVLAFYVSGHGFGHASRDIEVINAIRRRAPAVRVVVRTSASPWLFNLTLDAPVEFHEAECDTGVVQIGSLSLDEQATLARAGAFYDDWRARVGREAEFLRGERAGLVVADIPPLGIAAAKAAGVPAVALSNFTWDWIYEAYLPPGGPTPGFIAVIRDAYRAASMTLRLPLCGGFASVDPATIVDIPLVARHARRPPAETRATLGLPAELPLALLSFGGYGLEALSLDALRLGGWGVVTTSQVGVAPPSLGGPTPVFTIDERAMYAAGFRYEDLVAACEVVVSKPGYGIIAECAANGAALLYTSRGRFAEYDVLVAALPALLRSRFIPQDDLFAGRWQPYLDMLMAAPRSPQTVQTNGADVAAELILKLLRQMENGMV